ncbi:MAG: lipid-A-disaccharide synthase [Microscillaceae bacterium]
MKYYLIAGERSGDMHGANLMKALRQQDPQAEFRFLGGEAMQAVGGTLVRHYRDLAFMGIWEVLQNIKTIRKYLRECQQDVQDYRPDALILIDYGGFNLRMARFVKAQQLPFKVIYYISPKVWAWNTGRARRIRQVVDKMLVIFPFEVDFYQKFDYQVDFVGNPLWDAIRDFRPHPLFREKHQLDSRPIVALLPGSRRQEVRKILRRMLSIREDFPDVQWVVAGVSNLPPEEYAPYASLSGVKVIFEDTYNLLTQAEAAVVTSGTATLETALFQVPQVVVYQTSWLTYRIAKLLVKVKYISLVNLVAGKEVVQELIQGDFHRQALQKALQAVRPGGARHEAILQDYTQLAEQLGKTGASVKAATQIQNYLSRKAAQ